MCSSPSQAYERTMLKKSKAPATTVSPSEVRNVVASEDAFGHEMRVGGVIRGVRGIALEHAGPYTDPALGKPRQFDYRCWLRKEAACLSLAVECKSLSQSVGLAVCGTKRRDDEAFHDLIESRTTPEGPGFRVCGWDSATLRATGKDSIYPPDGFVGKNLVPIQSSNGGLVRMRDSDVYDGWAQAISSAVELAESACRTAKTFSEKEFSLQYYRSWSFPTIGCGKWFTTTVGAFRPILHK